MSATPKWKFVPPERELLRKVAIIMRRDGYADLPDEIDKLLATPSGADMSGLWSELDIVNRQRELITQLEGQRDKVREALRNEVIHERGHDPDSQCTYWVCDLCNEGWVDDPEKHKPGCLAALREVS